MCTNIELNELIKAVDEALPHEVSGPRLEKQSCKHTQSSYWDYSQTTTSLLTTNFTTKLFGPPWARSHHLKYVTYGYTKCWNSCPKTHHTRTKSKLVPVSWMIHGYMILEKAPAYDVADFFQMQTTSTISWDLHLRHHPNKSHSWIPRVQRQKIQNLKRAGYQICTELTETYQYLYRTSCHPNSVFHGFITGTMYPKDPHKTGLRQPWGIPW